MSAVLAFDYKDYRKFLYAKFPKLGPHRGQRAALAGYLKCQSSFISQVLTERTHLSLEQALKTTQFLNMSESERTFFLLQVQKEKAGTKDLYQYFDSQIKKILERRQTVSERVMVQEKLTESERAFYYGSWWYAAIHILVALPEFQTLNSLQQKLHLPFEVIQTALDFLTKNGLVEEEKGMRYKIGKTRIHLEGNSPIASQHHTNWRLRAIQAAEKRDEKNLHYSMVLGVSRKDAIILKNQILELIEKSEVVIRISKEEAAFAMNFDFFEI